MQALELGIPTQQSDLDLPLADDVRINDQGAVNFRSEGRSFAKNNRCLIPASAFFEFTGKRYQRASTASRCTTPFMAIAVIWRESKAEGLRPLRRSRPSPARTSNPYHDRQVVVLQLPDWAHWIYPTRPKSELLRPPPTGSFDIETVRAGRNAAAA